MSRLLRDLGYGLFFVALTITVETLLLISRNGVATVLVYGVALVAFYALGDATGAARIRARWRQRLCRDPHCPTCRDESFRREMK